MIVEQSGVGERLTGQGGGDRLDGFGETSRPRPWPCGVGKAGGGGRARRQDRVRAGAGARSKAGREAANRPSSRVAKVVAIGRAQVRIGDRPGGGAQPLAQPGLPLGRVERFGVALADEQRLDERRGRRPSWAFSAAGPCSRSTSSGSLPPASSDEAEAAAGLQQRQGAVDRPRGGALARRRRRRSTGSARDAAARAAPSGLRSARCPSAPRPATPARWQAMTSI